MRRPFAIRLILTCIRRRAGKRLMQYEQRLMDAKAAFDSLIQANDLAWLQERLHERTMERDHAREELKRCNHAVKAIERKAKEQHEDLLVMVDLLTAENELLKSQKEDE